MLDPGVGSCCAYAETPSNCKVLHDWWEIVSAFSLCDGRLKVGNSFISDYNWWNCWWDRNRNYGNQSTLREPVTLVIPPWHPSFGQRKPCSVIVRRVARSGPSALRTLRSFLYPINDVSEVLFEASGNVGLPIYGRHCRRMFAVAYSVNVIDEFWCLFPYPQPKDAPAQNLSWNSNLVCGH